MYEIGLKMYELVNRDVKRLSNAIFSYHQCDAPSSHAPIATLVASEVPSASACLFEALGAPPV